VEKVIARERSSHRLEHLLLGGANLHSLQNLAYRGVDHEESNDNSGNSGSEPSDYVGSYAWLNERRNFDSASELRYFYPDSNARCSTLNEIIELSPLSKPDCSWQMLPALLNGLSCPRGTHGPNAEDQLDAAQIEAHSIESNDMILHVVEPMSIRRAQPQHRTHLSRSRLPRQPTPSMKGVVSWLICSAAPRGRTCSPIGWQAPWIKRKHKGWLHGEGLEFPEWPAASWDFDNLFF
jgi:hypothetical protein